MAPLPSTLATLAMGLAAAALSSFPRACHALDNGFVRPAMGFSTWNHFQGNVDDALLREVAQAMVSTGLRDAGYVFLNLDDG